MIVEELNLVFHKDLVDPVVERGRDRFHALYVRVQEVQLKDVEPPCIESSFDFIRIELIMNAVVNPSITEDTSKSSTSDITFARVVSIFLSIVGTVFVILLHAAAAKLSYDKYQSIFWAIIDFVFAVFYIPYYAFVLNTPSTPTMIGGRHKRR